ncbi:metal ABC transporter solute-binding protein, Zn/Mn family [Saccharicrinis sp. 156]|uniref:metal ABC transporter solute-binding protein, Zn/Mn family n=1 Tax=Saccharicrinis sp. 156 TaxID=3417574 RepID=UPI003D358139
MKYYSRTIVNAAVITLIIFCIASCQSKPISKNNISVSILPQKYLVEQLLGDSTPVNVMIPKGASPATYSPSPSQIKNLSQSLLYLKIGHIGFEQAWTKRIAEINPDLKIEDTSKGIALIRDEDHVHGDHIHKGGIDPHIWTSPKTMMIVLKNTEEALSKAFPHKKELIISNSKKLKRQISDLDNTFFQTCDSFKNSKFYIFHPAYTYLARDYGLEQISVEHKGKEPSAQWIKKLIDDGREQNIKAIFVQEEFDKRNAEVISSELNIPIIQVNPLSEDWFVEMNHLLSKLEKTLR